MFGPRGRRARSDELDDTWQRAFDAQRQPARAGRHRAAGIADLHTAVLAAHRRIALVHYDADFAHAPTLSTAARKAA